MAGEGTAHSAEGKRGLSHHHMLLTHRQQHPRKGGALRMREGGARGSGWRSSNKLRTHLVQKRGSQEPRGDSEGCGKRALGEATDVSLRQGLFSGLCKPVVPPHPHRLGGEWRVGRWSGRERREPQQNTETVFPTKPSGWGQ